MLSRFAVEAVLPPDLPAALIDPALIGQALVNLLENATKYAAEGSTIRIIGAADPAGVTLTVCDEGPGIAVHERLRVFELFYRVAQGDGQPAGTGLGLAIVKGLVEANGGSVAVIDPPSGRGAAIRMSPPPPWRRPKMTDRPCRLLVIEDETPIRRFLRVVLEGAGHVMDEAARGREGIERAATGAPDVVLLELGLPDMDGKEVIRAIREWSSVPILVVSVRTAETEIIAALDAGADDYVTKPFATGELLARLHALARRRPAGAPSALVTVGALTIDRAERRASLRDEALALTRKEFDVLALLAANAGRLITHTTSTTCGW